MATKADLLAHLTRLGIIVRSAHVKRALTSVDPNPSLNFWRLIYGTLLDVAVLEWCKIFGADAEPTHWKRVVSDHDAFRSQLLDSLHIAEVQWAAYREEMKAYRDGAVAHQTDDPQVSSYPHLELALESSYFYYSYVIRELRRLGEKRFPDDLRNYSTAFRAQSRKIAERAILATSAKSEEVDIDPGT